MFWLDQRSRFFKRLQRLPITFFYNASSVFPCEATHYEVKEQFEREAETLNKVNNGDTAAGL